VVHRQSLPDYTLQLLKVLRSSLYQEISQSAELRPALNLNAATITDQFLGDLVNLRHLLQTDVEAAYDGDPAAQSTEEVMLAYPGIEAVAAQRMAHLLYRAQVPLLPRMMTEWAHSRTGIDIHPGAEIGTHFFVDHGTGVVVGETCVIGNHVRLYQGVTLGGRSVASRVKRDPSGTPANGKRHPTIEDEVTIYAAATILGGDTVIGARSVIGGNVWLTHSLPPDSVAFYEGTHITIRSRLAQGGDFQI
jgi:serine O-acetyltransferase